MRLKFVDVWLIADSQTMLERRWTKSLRHVRVEEILQIIETGEIIEQYLDDTPYASCLILGYTRSGRPLHLVCAPVSH